ELRYFRSRLTCLCKGVLTNLYGAVALHRIDLKTSGHQSSRDTIITRARLQGSNVIAITCSSTIVIKLRIFGEDCSELVCIAGNKRCFKERIVHACKLVEKRPAAY